MVKRWGDAVVVPYVVKASLESQGLDKLLVDDVREATITNGEATILLACFGYLNFSLCSYSFDLLSCLSTLFQGALVKAPLDKQA